eukprot:9110478-Lingulodinium_polyedra.AAC.1
MNSARRPRACQGVPPGRASAAAPARANRRSPINAPAQSKRFAHDPDNPALESGPRAGIQGARAPMRIGQPAKVKARCPLRPQGRQVTDLNHMPCLPES